MNQGPPATATDHGPSRLLSKDDSAGEARRTSHSGARDSCTHSPEDLIWYSNASPARPA